jgi:hypothetical protein
MTVYGTGVYGTDVYGGGTPASPDGAVQWICQIAWDGSFDGTNEAGFAGGLWNIKRGREFYVASGAGGIEAIRPGTATIILNNDTGRYDPYTYPNVTPGKKIFISVKDISSGTVYPLFMGHITDIKPFSDDKKVTITAADGLQWLDDQELVIAAASSTTISAAITTVLNAAGYPWAKSIQTWAQPIPVFDPSPATYDSNLKGVRRTPFTAASVLGDLADASLGTLFADASGVMRYYPLDYAGMTTHDLDQAVLLKEIKVGQPWENIRNKVKVSAIRRGKRPLAALWQLASPMEFTPLEGKRIKITFQNSTDLATPVWGQWTANSAADGSGTDESLHFSFALEDVTTSSATLYIFYGYPTGNAFLSKVSVYGKEVVEIPVQYTAEDAGSIASYGPRRFNLENPWLQDAGYAQAFATLIKDQLHEPTKDPVIRIDTREDIQYSIELMDKIHLTSAKLGIDAAYSVGGIEHKWQSETGQSVLTTLYLQSVIYSGDAITADVFYPGVDLQPELPPTTTPPSVTMTGDATCLSIRILEINLLGYTSDQWAALDIPTMLGVTPPSAKISSQKYVPDIGSWFNETYITAPSAGYYLLTVDTLLDISWQEGAYVELEGLDIARNPSVTNIWIRNYLSNPAVTGEYQLPYPKSSASNSCVVISETASPMLLQFRIKPFSDVTVGIVFQMNMNITITRIGDIPS